MVKRRKSTVAPPPAHCPIRACMEMLGGAWVAEIIWYLRGGKRCFTELRLDLGPVSAKVLTAQLRRLELSGIIQRTTAPTSPPTVWYALTCVGQEFGDAVRSLVEIAQRLPCAHRSHATTPHARSANHHEGLAGGSGLADR